MSVGIPTLALLSTLLAAESVAYWGFSYRAPSGRYAAALRYITAPLHVTVLHHPLRVRTRSRAIKALIDWNRHPTLSRLTLTRTSDFLLEQAASSWSYGELHDDALRLLWSRLCGDRHFDTRMLLVRRAASASMLAEAHDFSAPLTPTARHRLTSSIVASDRLSLVTFQTSTSISSAEALKMISEHLTLTGTDLLAERWPAEHPEAVAVLRQNLLRELATDLLSLEELLGSVESRIPAAATGWAVLAARLKPQSRHEALVMLEDHSREWRRKPEYVARVVQLVNAGSPGSFSELCEVVDVLELQNATLQE
jgi:hypothetical protein